MPVLSLAVVAALAAAATEPLVVVDRDDVRITTSCRVRVAPGAIADTNGDGVVHIVAPGIAVEFETPLRGAPTGTAPSAMTGIGISVRAEGVELRGAVVSGFKVGIEAIDADRLVIEDCDVSDNFAQHLRSTPKAEDGGDWLWPHQNDERQWRESYGAGIWIEDSSDVTVRRVRARRTQNGIILSGVNDSRVYDNDCSFLSGWGVAMWRSSRNTITRNALDFCVRGYSHGVYNRGQDSAGLLMFEQCSSNLVAENSITHGGDGVFAFAGREALGEGNPRPDENGAPAAWYERRGNNGNHFRDNDLSDAVAHGLELTFSFDNLITGNRFDGNGICGIWGGYSQGTLIRNNIFTRNGDAGYGLERGGVNIEHGADNVIVHNVFEANACGVHLWWDPDEGLMGLPWARRNERGSTDNVVAHNRFSGNEIPVQLRSTGGRTLLRANQMEADGKGLQADEKSPIARGDFQIETDRTLPEVPQEVLGASRPVGARDDLRGRATIIMGPWSPYDWEGPFVQPLETSGGRHEYRLLGSASRAESVAVDGPVDWSRNGDRIVVEAREAGTITGYTLRVGVGDRTIERRGTLARIDWTVTVFPWTIDPREDADGWHAEADTGGVTVQRSTLDLVYGMGGPAGPLGQAAKDIGSNQFGTLATTLVKLPAGAWRLRSRSDDGVRIRVDGETVIDDWTWHAPKEHEHVLRLDRERTVEIAVEHFELDGYAVLEVTLERAEE